MLDLHVDAGEVVAFVQGSRSAPYRVRLRVRRFDDREWDRLDAAIAAQAGHAAALLDGELDPGVVDDAARRRGRAAARAGRARPSCSCPDWADPCKHAAAVCYLVADALDDDPFALLLLRGRGREEVLAGVRAARSDQPLAAAAAPALVPPPDRGVPAAASWRGAAGEAPAHLSPPARPGVVRRLDAPAGRAVDVAALAALAADVATRAHRMLVDDQTAGLELAVADDLARRAADALDAGTAGTGAFDELARRVGRHPRHLERSARAWRAGGAIGVALLDGRGAPLADAELLAAGAAVLADAGVVGVSVRRDRLVVGGTHLVIGVDRRWYALERRGRTFELHLPPADDPAELIDLP